MINIKYPTMGFIGVPRNTTGFYLFDLQVIYCIINNNYIYMQRHNIITVTLRFLHSQPTQFNE